MKLRGAGIWRLCVHICAQLAVIIHKYRTIATLLTSLGLWKHYEQPSPLGLQSEVNMYKA